MYVSPYFRYTFLVKVTTLTTWRLGVGPSLRSERAGNDFEVLICVPVACSVRICHPACQTFTGEARRSDKNLREGLDHQDTEAGSRTCRHGHYAAGAGASATTGSWAGDDSCNCRLPWSANMHALRTQVYGLLTEMGLRLLPRCRWDRQLKDEIEETASCSGHTIRGYRLAEAGVRLILPCSVGGCMYGA